MFAAPDGLLLQAVASLKKMRFYWRNEQTPLTGYAGWIGHIDPKNRQPGTSAPTLASAWSGALDLLAALATQPSVAGLRIDRVVVEARATFDRHGGNVRNHDLVLHATTATNQPVVVCVEAKAGEQLGDTVAQQPPTSVPADAPPRGRARPVFSWQN